MESLATLDRQTLEKMLEDFAKNWLAHDGLWFQGVESRFGLETAIEIDKEAWRQFSVIEAQRIVALHSIPPNSGLPGLRKALGFRLYALLNKQEFRNETAGSFEFYMVDCRVQSARRRKQLPLFPCKTVGLVEYEWFAKTIDPRIRTECLCCPPDAEAGKGFFCGWRFSI